MAGTLERLAKTAARLDDGRRASLLAFAEFLLAQMPPPVTEAPRAIPRPDEESVVGAIRRLRETYPGVDGTTLFDDVAACMSGHLLRGRPAGEVIDELEELFGNAHQKANAARNEE